MFGVGLLAAHGPADPHRLDKRHADGQDGKQVRYRNSVGAAEVNQVFPSRDPFANGQISANVKTASIDHLSGLAAHHALERKSAFIAAMP